MLPEKMEQGFNQNLEAIQLLQNALGTSFLEAYVENAENLIDDYQVRVVDGVPTKETTQRITALYEELKKLSFEPEEWRRLSQLLLLKGSQTEHLQANHQLTPDSIGFLFVFHFFPPAFIFTNCSDILQQITPMKYHKLPQRNSANHPNLIYFFCALRYNIHRG